MKKLIFAVVPALSLTACFSPHSSAPPDAVLDQQGQYFPVLARFSAAGETISLELARTPEQIQIGAMHRIEPFEKNHGILFDFPGQPKSQWFWMKNVNFPLDMLFLRSGIIQAIASEAQPCLKDPCVHYDPHVPVDQVIELRAGRAKELKLKAGDSVTVEVGVDPAR